MNLVPDASLLAIVVIFWITYWILRWSLFGPVQEILRERREAVETARAEQEAAAEQTAEKIDAERDKLNRARVEAAAQRDELRRTAESRRQEILASTRQETERRLGEAQDELDGIVASERRALEAKARMLADRMTEKLLEKSA